LVDGLGQDAIDRYGSQFPAFASLTQSAILDSTFPSTTATALATLGTGTLPGAHGMLGYTVRVPRSGTPGRLLNALKWDERVDPAIWQSQPTMYERAIEHGITSSYIAAKRYEGTGFSRATLRGSAYVGANYMEDMVKEAVKALSTPQSFAYLYVNNLDHAGHNDGVGSEKWLDAFRIIDGLVAQLQDALPAGTQFVLTADHGMVNVGDSVVMGRDNSLLENVTLVGGEPRARHLYVTDGSLDDVKAAWRESLGDKVDLYTKSDAEKLFGPDISEDALDRMGDLIVVPHGNLILIDPARVPQESSMVGHHGGTTDIEVKIPLLTREI
jgi:hypothetical protein